MKEFTTNIIKAIIATIIAFSPALAWATVAGDVNGDGVCTASDVTALYNYILYNDNSAIVNGDQNGDNAITASDVTAVYNIILGIAQSTDNEEELFARCYATLRSEEPIDGFDESLSSFLRSMWQLNTITTDEAYCLWLDKGIHEMNTNQWGSDLPQAEGLFYRLCANIDVCNTYLANSSKHDDAHNGEVRTIRALYHYYLMDLFGNVPYNTNAATPTLMATQTPRATVYANLLNELKECENLLVEPRTNSYGRIDKAAAWMLIARISLNQRVYAPSNQSIIVNIALSQAKEYASKVIQSAYQLNTSSSSGYNAYQMLFLGDNDTNGAQKEIIWPIPFNSDDNRSFQWSGTTFLVAACASYNNDFPNGLSGEWNGVLARPEFFSSRFGLNTSSLSGANSPSQIASMLDDNRALFFNDGAFPLEQIQEDMSFSKGVGYLKYLNMNSDGSNPATTYANTDYPLMRFAEALLTYAEADTRLNSGTCSSDALQSLNVLQMRAGATTLRSANLNTILNMWSKEFGFEGLRRTNLIRFDNYGNTYGTLATNTWNWKGGAINGRLFDKSKNVFAIPAKAIQENSSLVQNDGYDIQYPLHYVYLSTVGNIDGVVEEATLEWDPVTSTEHIIHPLYEVWVSDNMYFTNYEKIFSGELEDTRLELDINQLKIIAQRFRSSKLYFTVRSNASGTGDVQYDFSSKDFGFDIGVNPYWLVGDCVGDGMWTNNSDPWNANMVPMLPDGDGFYIYAGYFPAGGQFLIISEPGSWKGAVYGGSENGGQEWSGDGYPNGNNIVIENGGYYMISINQMTQQVSWSTYNPAPTTYSSMGIIGEFSDWNLDEEMSMLDFNANNNHNWIANLTLNSDSELKFRANNEWTYNWGNNQFPSGVGYKGGNNIPAKAGNYKVYFNDILGTYLFYPITQE